MKRLILGMAAGLLTLGGLAVSPTVARAEHRDRDHHHHGGHWGHHHNRGNYYAPYRSFYAPSYYGYGYAAPVYGYSYPYYAPYYVPVNPGFGIGYQSPNVSFWLGR